jgi:hypothetical protein
MRMQGVFIINTAHNSYTGIISAPLPHALPPGLSPRLRLKYAQVPNAMRKASKTPHDAKRGIKNPTRRQSNGIRLDNKQAPSPDGGATFFLTTKYLVVIQLLAVPVGLIRLFALDDTK